MAIANCARVAQGDDERQRLLKRPVDSRQVADSVTAMPQLSVGSRSLSTALREAVRIRPGMQQSSVVRIGSVGRTSFYHTEDSEEARAYVAYRSAEKEMTRSRLRVRIEEFDTARILSSGGASVVPRQAIDARAEALASEVAGYTGDLKRALAIAGLLPGERLGAEQLLFELKDLERRIGVDVPSGSSENRNAGDVSLTLLDSRKAWDQIAGFADFDSNPRLLTNKLSREVGRVRPGEEGALPYSDPVGRPVSTYLDRVSFAAEVMIRWGGPRISTLAATGIHALGDLRDPVPFIDALESDEERRSHMAAVAALGLLDDPASRECLAAYVTRQTRSWVEGSTRFNGPPLALALYGLAPKPGGGLATCLSNLERAALDEAVAGLTGEWTAQVAERVLRAWDEAWAAERLLQL